MTDASGFPGAPDREFSPASAEELAAILGEASASSTPVTFKGAATGVTGACCPLGGWLIDMRRFRHLEIHPGRASAGAAVSLQKLNAAAHPTGQFFAPDPTEWTASVGGAIATNASGSRSFLYGSTRRHVLALTCVFATGRIRRFTRDDKIDFDVPTIPLPQTTKSTAGYPLSPGMTWIDLLCGSEGTLAAVTEAELQLLPLPKDLLTGVIFFPSGEHAVSAVESWRALERLRMLEYLDSGSLDLLRNPFPEIPASAQAALLIEQENGDTHAWLDRFDAAHALDDSWLAATPADRERFRRFRHALPELVNDRVRRNGFQKLGSDFAVPIARNREMLAIYHRELNREFPGRYVLFGHIGDAHLHANILPSTPAEESRAKELLKELAKTAVSLGGAVSAEHGLGKRKSHLLSLQYPPHVIEAMRNVKRRLDPNAILGQGNIFPT